MQLILGFILFSVLFFSWSPLQDPVATWNLTRLRLASNLPIFPWWPARHDSSAMSYLSPASSPLPWWVTTGQTPGCSTRLTPSIAKASLYPVEITRVSRSLPGLSHGVSLGIQNTPFPRWPLSFPSLRILIFLSESHRVFFAYVVCIYSPLGTRHG